MNYLKLNKIDIKYKHDPHDFEILILEYVKRSIIEKAGDLICPDHNENATLTFEGSSFKELTLDLHTCCDKFYAIISERLNK